MRLFKMKFNTTAVVFIASVFGLAGPVWAQTSSPAALSANSRVEQAQRFPSNGTTGNFAGQDGGLIPAGLAPASPGDADIGQQVLLKRRDKATPFSAFATLSGFYTSNAALTNTARVDDYFFVGEVGVSYQPRITKDLVAEITVRQADFRYARYDVLDFESLNVGAGLTYAPHFLGGVALSARYNYNRLTDGKEHDEFFKNQTLTLAALRSFELSKAQYIYVGCSAVLGWSDPVAPQRDEYGVSLGHHVNWSRALSSDVFYRAARFDYTHGRNDWNQTLAVSVKWDVTRWFNLTGTLSEGFNNSNRHVYNYEVFNGGIVLAGTITF
jgi:hypothetical protein